VGKRKEFTLTISVMGLANVHVVAFTTLGGIMVKGRMAEDIGSAIRNLFTALGHNQSEDALLAIDLMVAGEDISKAFEQAALDDASGA
jgi:hypothetical protein